MLDERCAASSVRAASADRRLPHSQQSRLMERAAAFIRIVSHDRGYPGEIAKVHFEAELRARGPASSVVMRMSPSLRCTSLARQSEHSLLDHYASG